MPLTGTHYLARTSRLPLWSDCEILILSPHTIKPNINTHNQPTNKQDNNPKPKLLALQTLPQAPHQLHSSLYSFQKVQVQMASPYSTMQIAGVPAAAAITPNAALRTQAQAALAQLAEDFAVLEDSDPVSAFEVARTPMRRRGGTLRPGNFEYPSFRQGRMPGAVCG
ncbi:hypothetical protein FJTKL_09494 [Diaporthe vaccinii]|uniref:Uncharacterized protein n=2 Tax=Diaporthe eres species complex TaxID=2972384 RepID=A0ABR4FCX6_9PEZI